MKSFYQFLKIFLIFTCFVFFYSSCCKSKLEDCKKAVTNSPEFPDSLIKNIIYTSIESYNQKGYDSLVLRNTKNELFVFKFNYKKGFTPAEPKVFCSVLGGFNRCFGIFNRSNFNASSENLRCKIFKIIINNENQSLDEISNDFYNEMEFHFKSNDSLKVFRSYSFYTSKINSNINVLTVNINNKIITLYELKYGIDKVRYFPLSKILYSKEYKPAIIYFQDDTLYNTNI